MLSPFVQGVVTLSWNNTLILYNVFHTDCNKRLSEVPQMRVFLLSHSTFSTPVFPLIVVICGSVLL